MTLFELNHKDLIHDISYDFYGSRMASCSSDQRIKVFDKSEGSNGSWVLNDEWKAHDASVLKVKWAHPEFGQIIASSSFDRSVRVWEEVEQEPKGSGKRWVERARLVDSRGSVQDIEFGPKHLGLKLASTSTDGQVRIYEALDVMNVSHWTLMEEFQICPTSREVDGQFCLSWCPNRFLPPMLVVGCGKEFTARIYRYDENNRKWTILIESIGIHGNFVYDVAWAPNMGRSYELIATANKDSHVRIFKISGVTNSGSAVGANSAPKQPLFKSLLSGVGSSGNQANLEASQTLPNSSGSLAPEVELIGDFTDHQAEVWRVSWNMTGNILSSSGDDGHVRLWKTDPFGVWRQMSILPST